MKSFLVFFLLMHLIHVVFSSPLPFAFVRELELRLNKQYGALAVSYLRQMLKNFDTAPAKLPAEEEAAIKDILTKHFGAEVYRQYQQIDTQETNDEETKLIKNVIRLLKQQFYKLGETREKVLRPSWGRFLALAATAKQIDKQVPHDVPCKDEASCAKLEHLVNRCNYAREGAMRANNIFNIVTHVLNSLMSLMCGCLFVGPIHQCILQHFPYTCKLPYPVYASLYMGSSQVWEVVKATSNLCRLYGDPGLGSVVQ